MGESAPGRSCVIYARYSSHNQNDASIEQQVAECRRFAEERGLAVLEVYADRAISGTTDNRPEFLRMIRDSAGGRWQYVLTWKVDRFARNRYDAATYKYRLKRNGVSVLYAKESIPDGPEGILLEAILEGSAEYYSANLSQNVRRGMEANARACKVNGRPPYGYRKGPDGRLEIVEEEAEIVRVIFARYAAGEGKSAIVRDLNGRGVTRQGRVFSQQATADLLANEAYAGVYHYGGVRIEGGVPAIVDRSVFDSCAIRMEAARNAPSPRPRQRTRNFILTGRLCCGLCGARMSGYSTKNGGQRRAYYRCQNHRAGACPDSHLAPAPWIESEVVRATREYVLVPEVIEWIADAVMQLQAAESVGEEAVALRRRLSEVEAAAANVLTAIEAGILTPSTKERLESLEGEASAIRARLEGLAEVDPPIERDFVVWWLNQFRAGTAGVKEEADALDARLVQSLVSSVTLCPDCLRIFYQYAGEGAGVVLAEDGTPPPPPGGPDLFKENLVYQTCLKQTGDAVLFFWGPSLILDVPRASGMRRGASAGRNE